MEKGERDRSLPATEFLSIDLNHRRYELCRLRRTWLSLYSSREGSAYPATSVFLILLPRYLNSFQGSTIGGEVGSTQPGRFDWTGLG